MPSFTKDDGVRLTEYWKDIILRDRREAEQRRQNERDQTNFAHLAFIALTVDHE